MYDTLFPRSTLDMLSFYLIFCFDTLAPLALSLSPSFIQNTDSTRQRHGIGLGLCTYIVLSITLASH